MTNATKWATGYRGIWHMVTVQDDGSADEAMCGQLVKHHAVYDAPVAGLAGGGKVVRRCSKCRAAAGDIDSRVAFLGALLQPLSDPSVDHVFATALAGKTVGADDAVWWEINRARLVLDSLGAAARGEVVHRIKETRALAAASWRTT